MEYIAHRINTLEELSRLPGEYGVELDLRDAWDGSIHISHDPCIRGTDLEAYLREYHHGTMILNIKSEGIEEKVLEMLKKYGIEKFMFLDSSFPMIVSLCRKGERRIALRLSEWEGMDTARNMAGKVEWIWMDCFTKIPIGAADYLELKGMGYKLCFVSPELQGREDEVERYAGYLRDRGMMMDGVCTKVHCIEKWERACPNWIMKDGASI